MFSARSTLDLPTASASRRSPGSTRFQRVDLGILPRSSSAARTRIENSTASRTSPAQSPSPIAKKASRKSHNWERAGVRAAMLLLLAACSEDPKPAAKPEATDNAKTDRAIAQVFAEAEKLETEKAAEEIDQAQEQAIADYKREHPFANAVELLKQEAFLEKLRPQLEAAVKDHQFMERVQKAVDLAGQLKDNSATGTYQLDLQVETYNPRRTDRLLGTVLSGKPEKLVDYVVSEVAEAGAEFVLSSNTNRTTNGILVKPKEEPKPAAPPQE